MLEAYRNHVAERAAEGVVPKPLNAQQVAELVKLFETPPAGEEAFILDLLENRIPPGVDEAAYVKAAFLDAVAKGTVSSPILSAEHAVKLLGTMQGGYNIEPLIDQLDNAALAPLSVTALSNTLLMFDSYHDVVEKMQAGNDFAKQVVDAWANADWFLNRPKLADKVTLTVFKVSGETNTDDLSPAPDAWSRPDIPLHALAMLKNARDGIVPDESGVVGPIKEIEALKGKGHPLVYVGDVVGTGSSRKSATNSVLWFMGDDIPFVPNKRAGGFCLGNKIAPIFFNTMEDAGALPIELNVDQMDTGDVIDIYPYEGVVKRHGTDEVISTFELKTEVLLDEVRAGGRIPLIIGRGLTDRARETLGLEASKVFVRPQDIAASNKGFTLAQKMVGKACGVSGVRPGQYCEPKMTSVGSQDTTGPMTRDELKDLACLGFSADLTMQSFCHT
ncbi:MAG TPA: aconitate hydratase B, partial [Shewanella frigidimarina]|nr:aconitate hydratase B [Shewanella frigidimarina]